MKRVPFASVVLLLLVSIATVTLYSGCHNTKKKEPVLKSVDSTGQVAINAQMDSVIAQYVVAADSLAALFDGIETLDDVVNRKTDIQKWSGIIRSFQDQSARYGQPLVDRMSTPRVDSAWGHLTHARERLKKKPEVYLEVARVEEGAEGPLRNSSQH